MSCGRRTKTEHGGAKNGGGFWGPREDAKTTSRKLRRQRAKAAAVEPERCSECGKHECHGHDGEP